MRIKRKPIMGWCYLCGRRVRGEQLMIVLSLPILMYRGWKLGIADINVVLPIHVKCGVKTRKTKIWRQAKIPGSVSTRDFGPGLRVRVWITAAGIYWRAFRAMNARAPAGASA